MNLFLGGRGLVYSFSSYLSVRQSSNFLVPKKRRTIMNAKINSCPPKLKASVCVSSLMLKNYIEL